MEVIVRPEKVSAEKLTALLIARALRRKPRLVLGLATGETMERVYSYLVEMHEHEGLDFSLCRTFNLDEYIGLPAEHPQSYRSYMNRLLFDQVNIDPRNTFLPDGTAKDLKKACRQYEAQIKELGGIDLQLVGIGRVGHIGFNEPLSALRSRTRDKTLAPSTMAQNKGFFEGSGEAMPSRAITMGVGTIIESRRVLLLATGHSKADILAKAVEGPVTSMVTASALQLHKHATVVVDESAAANLQGIEYYRWIFENEPEWAEFHGV